MTLADIIQGLSAGRFSPGEKIAGDIFDIVILSHDRFQIRFQGQPPEIWRRVSRR